MTAHQGAAGELLLHTCLHVNQEDVVESVTKFGIRFFRHSGLDPESSDFGFIEQL
jgi:hypothetical protein